MQNHRSIMIILLFIAVVWCITGCRYEPVLTPTPIVEVQQAATHTQTQAPKLQETLTPTNTLPPTITPTVTETLNPIQEYGIYWMADFETGDLSQYEEFDGEFIRQSAFGSYAITTNEAVRGNFSAALTIDTDRLSSGAAAAYLAYYNNPREGYYSGWIYIPEDVVPLTWWNVWQWKSTYNGDSDDSVPMWTLDLTTIATNPDELRLTLVYRPDSNSLKESFTNAASTIPKGEWVHISTYYVKSTKNDGIVGVWINGEEIFYIENAHTVQSDNTLYWLVNNYSPRIQPSPCTIYFDDMVISQQRIRPDSVLP